MIVEVFKFVNWIREANVLEVSSGDRRLTTEASGIIKVTAIGAGSFLEPHGTRVGAACLAQTFVVFTSVPFVLRAELLHLYVFVGTVDPQHEATFEGEGWDLILSK